MVTRRKQHSSQRPLQQGPAVTASRPNKIGASTPYHFRGKKPILSLRRLSAGGREGADLRAWLCAMHKILCTSRNALETRHFRARF